MATWCFEMVGLTELSCTEPSLVALPAAIVRARAAGGGVRACGARHARAARARESECTDSLELFPGSWQVCTRRDAGVLTGTMIN